MNKESPNSSKVSDAYKQEHARAEALFSNIGTGAIATDEHGRIYRINDTALGLLGYKRKEVLGKWYPKIVIARNMEDKIIEPLERPITRVFVSGKPISETSYYQTKTNKRVPVTVTVSPVLLDGKPIGAVEVFQDISLEYEVDRMKSEFISIASHQLRTPLSAINTYASMLHGGFYGKLNKDQLTHMSTILSAVKRMNELIATLLDVSQIEAGKIRVTSQDVNLNELLKNIVAELVQQANERNVQVSVSMPDRPIIITSDTLLLGEVYSNLISNAIKYNPPNGSVVIALTQTTKQVIFSVMDTGYGIPQNVQKYIFTKFYRADNIKKIDTTGTGLGLYLAKQIAEILNGRIWFESKEKKGSTFYFSLPKKQKTI